MSTNVALRAISLADFLGQSLPKREVMLQPWLLSQSLNMVYAWRGIGKTHFCLYLAYAVASGGQFLNWQATKPRPVLYIDGEMPATALHERLLSIVESTEKEAASDFFRLITPDLQPGFMPDLATTAGQRAIGEVLGESELIIVDNLSCLVRSGGKENDAESWGAVAEWALAMRAEGRSVLFIHHSGKNGDQRGTSKKEDLLDCVICLKRPLDYNPSQGAAFEVHFGKSRAVYGKELQPIEARLETDQTGRQTWTIASLEQSTFDRVLTLANSGVKQAEIALQLGIHKSNVCRAIQRARQEALLERRPD